MVPADSARIPRVPAYSGAVSVSLCISPTGLSPAAALLSRRFGYAPAVHSSTVLQPRSAPKRGRFGLLRVRSPLLAQSLVYFLFLRVLRCFSSPGSPLHYGRYRPEAGGLPHSDICGSRDICSCPQLFAAYHVLRRLREPRHPSCALLSFLYDLSIFQSVRTSLGSLSEIVLLL